MPPLPPVINAVRTQHLSALAAGQRLRGQCHDPLFGIARAEVRLGVGDVAGGELAGALGVAGLDRIGELGVDRTMRYGACSSMDIHRAPAVSLAHMLRWPDHSVSRLPTTATIV